MTDETPTNIQEFKQTNSSQDFTPRYATQPDSDFPLHPKFPLGIVVATPAALAQLTQNKIHAAHLAFQHQSGDYGDLDAGDLEANRLALLNGDRIFSVYNIGDLRVYVITEADRSSTCVMLASEY